eukprot:TRINITY_DN3151_c0_g1_i1.p1 TRINITY_DN3151_c0_g1~~TRINITY_DN3151_c0_g1_i1.p1  ORF type:complete len:362 (+),score=77.26 TRINITY_DN3151_c0_g1_i1:178-1263(+)
MSEEATKFTFIPNPNPNGEVVNESDHQLFTGSQAPSFTDNCEVVVAPSEPVAQQRAVVPISDDEDLKAQSPKPQAKQQQQPVEHYAVFTWITLFINSAVMAYAMYKNDWKFESTSINPMYGPSTSVLEDLGGKKTSLIVDEGEHWRLFTPIYIHAGLIHFGMNMLVLVRSGRDLENAFGFWRIAFIYLLSGVFGNVCSGIFLPRVLSVGASGALYGLMGSMFGDLFQNYKLMEHGRCAYLCNLIFSSLVGLAFGLMPMLDNFQHVGGFLMGVLLGSCVLGGNWHDPQTGKLVINKSLILCCGSLAVVLFLGAFALFYGNQGGEWCSFCKYIDCVETPWWTCVPQICYQNSNGTIWCEDAAQ